MLQTIIRAPRYAHIVTLETMRKLFIMLEIFLVPGITARFVFRFNTQLVIASSKLCHGPKKMMNRNDRISAAKVKNVPLQIPVAGEHDVPGEQYCMKAHW